MIYAKINTDGTVAQFPYQSVTINNLRPNQTLPTDAVEVDTETNKPATTWKQVANFNSVEKSGDNYIATYTVADRYADDASKLKGITTLKKQHEGTNERNFAVKAKDLVSDYSEFERTTWNQQLQEATLYTADNGASTPLLSIIATERGITVADLVTKVLANATEYDTAFGSLLGKYQKNRSILNSIDLNGNTTWDSIDNIVSL